MAHKVIHNFVDLSDGHEYIAGDTFPRKGTKASAERLAELSCAENNMKIPLIQKVERRKKAIDNA